MKLRWSRLCQLITSILLLGSLSCTGLLSPESSSLNTLLSPSELADLFDPDSGPPCAEVGQPSSNVRLAMLDALNLYRLENGLEALVYSKRLEAAADAHTRDLWARDFFDHVNPDGDGPDDRALDAGFCHQYVGENIAAGQRTVQEVTTAWKNSPGHDANMLGEAYTYVGMGFFVDPNGYYYWAQVFAIDIPFF